MNNPSPFTDPPDTTVITLQRILNGSSAIRLVSHEDDGDWQFLDGDHVFESDAAVVELGTIVQFDPSLIDLANLPMGWTAWRADAGQHWQRSPSDGAE